MPYWSVTRTIRGLYSFQLPASSFQLPASSYRPSRSSRVWQSCGRRMPSRRAMVPRPLPGIEARVTRRILLAGLLLALSFSARPATTAPVRCRAAAVAAPPCGRQSSLSRHRAWRPILLAWRHGLGDVPPARSRGGRALSAEPRRSWASRWSRRSRSRSSTACTRRTRTAHTPLHSDDPTQPERGVLRPTWTGSCAAPTRSVSTSASCRRGATSGTSSAASAPRSSRRTTPSSTGRGSGAATRTTA